MGWPHSATVGLHLRKVLLKIDCDMSGLQCRYTALCEGQRDGQGWKALTKSTEKCLNRFLTHLSKLSGNHSIVWQKVNLLAFLRGDYAQAIGMGGALHTLAPLRHNGDISYIYSKNRILYTTPERSSRIRVSCLHE